MNILVVLALTLFLAGGFFRQTKAISSPSVPTSTPTPFSSPALPAGRQEPTAEAATPIPTTPVTVTPPSVTSDWQYPGGSQISAGVYESSDPSDKITDWYQDKIKQLGLNTKTFVRTKTNDRVLNKLVAAGISTEIRVEISKNPSDSLTRITVDY
ncbi:MAG: Uncharacterized protein G01um101416_202 [Microgenomates group bacterium Gr01-1014_16]|nr:MAG: Uncharacterized protein G01um101416_202 [Microgenomates group bacterium Gr01-1014_16]